MRQNGKPSQMSVVEQIEIATFYCDYRDRGYTHSAAVKAGGARTCDWAYRYYKCRLTELVRVVTERGYHRDVNEEVVEDVDTDESTGHLYCDFRQSGINHRETLRKMGINHNAWFYYVREGKHPAVRAVLIERGFLSPRRKSFADILPHILRGERVQRDGASWYIALTETLLVTYRAVPGGWERKEITSLIGADLLAKDWTILSDAE